MTSLKALWPSPGDELQFLESKEGYFAMQAVMAESAESAAWCATIAVATIKKADALRERIAKPRHKMTITRNPE